MKKNINIKIGGIIFHIDEGGYNKLMEYLESTKRSAASYNQPSLIMALIENRIAETFLSKLKEGIQVVTLEDVEDLTANRAEFIPFNYLKNTNYVYLF